jgi:hypothetical protein
MDLGIHRGLGKVLELIPFGFQVITVLNHRFHTYLVTHSATSPPESLEFHMCVIVLSETKEKEKCSP